MGEHMMRTWSGRLMAASAIAFLALTPARATDPPGFSWEMTSQMTMAGMPFTPPPTRLTRCLPRVWTSPPPGGDSSCVATNYQRVGSTVTWTMQCGGKMPMTGEGEITFDGPDSYSGAINATAEGMSMVIMLTGRKIGTCDKPIS